jgi:hypothetical protein
LENYRGFGDGPSGNGEFAGDREKGFTARYAISIFSPFHGDDEGRWEEAFTASVEKDIETLIPGSRLHFDSFRLDQGSISIAAVIFLYVPATYAGYRLCKELREIHELAEKIGEFVRHRVNFWVEKFYKTDYFVTESKVLIVNIDAPDLEREVAMAQRVARNGRVGGSLAYWLLRRNPATLGWVFFAVLGILILAGGAELWRKVDRLFDLIEHSSRAEALPAHL